MSLQYGWRCVLASEAARFVASQAVGAGMHCRRSDNVRVSFIESAGEINRKTACRAYRGLKC